MSASQTMTKPAPVDEQHARDLALWSELEGLARRGREACERGEQITELVALRKIRDVSHTLAVKP